MYPSNDATTEQDFIMPEHQRTKGIFEHGLTKDDVPVVVNAIVESILEKGNPLEDAESIKIMELIIEGVKAEKRFKDYALEELAKYGKKGFVSPRGVKIEPFESGGRYDYKVCNDPVVIELEENLKARQEFLKKLPKEGLEVVNQETGEVRKIFPAGKPVSTSTYKVTLPK